MASRPSPVQRALAVLRALSDPEVRRMSDVARATGLDPATASRLLDMLVREGFATRDAHRHFGIGPEIFQLADVGQRRVDLRQLARPALQRLVEAFGDTAVLTEASHGEAVCSDRERGTHPAHANYVTVGTRRPLGVGAGSLAVLAWLPAVERALRLQQTARKLVNYPRLTAAAISDEIDAAHARGHVMFLDWVVEGMGGIAVPILDYEGRPIGALSVVASSARLRANEPALARRLGQEARRIASAWTRMVVPTGDTHRAACRGASPRSGGASAPRGKTLASALP
ncbi:IclR family transcriptional regulator [Cupriavidus plantarum]|uniref:IclR family transcriptional regulator n=1 Tax=Cupriavidus plantarum TaxID=942865 RepID=UPI001B193979|nr:IclR family transcriptional regulator [Cupriavidus plantarum]CAG2128035.1 HTH-type transcriptional regulator KipR [Cupriavidus plantarum]SMR66787.1 transcriptional regulator, IclR family [Cupriavidus plantarum]